MNLNSNTPQGSRKKVVLAVIGVVVAAGIAFGGYVFLKKGSTRVWTTAESKERVINYLEKRSEMEDFKISLDVTKEKSPWSSLRTNYDAPPDYKTVYRLIGQHLFIADNLLESSEARAKQNGLRVISELCVVANEVAVDPWLGARIADAYIIPNLSIADDTQKHGMSKEQLMRVAGKAYDNADERESQIKLCKMYLADETLKKKGDYVRWRLATLLDSMGKHKEAVPYYLEITDPNFKSQVTRRLTLAERNQKKVNTTN